MSDLVAQVSRHLRAVQTLQEMALDAKLLPLIQGVQAWQTLRMQSTHQPQMNNSYTAPAMVFFTEQIYGPKDFSQRDAQIKRVVPKMHRYLPSKALLSLESALRLHALSYELDYVLALELKKHATTANQQLSISHRTDANKRVIINQQTYAAAFVSGHNGHLRQEQISLLQELGNNLSDAVAIKGVAMMLALSKHPARMKGLQTLHLFLQDGYKAFKKIPNSQSFMSEIVSREAHLVASLFTEQVFSQQGTNPLPCIPSVEILLES
ncbi:hypothetical protein WNY77_19480 [Paraglaciecola mesophila]|uniref:DUF8198 domain-containing protein n=1 Tax=Paraglaciecola mesophila TaxID=197222 RepID=A0ABU9T0F3_9ALTE